MKRNFKKYINEFGWKIFVSKAIRTQFFNSTTILSFKINQYNEALIEQTLNKIISSKKNYDNSYFKKITKVPYEPIWIMWWQGYRKAPKIVKACINSIKRNNPKHAVFLITKYNFTNYIKLPPFVINKFSVGDISVTHLSDIIRVILLYVYGGIWCDATLLDTATIPKSIFRSNFFTIKTGKKTKEPSNGQWTTFFMSSKPNNQLMKEIAIDHFKFWENHDEIIDYIMFDYIIKIIMKENYQVAKQIKDVPVNNPESFKMLDYLNVDYKIAKNELIRMEKNTFLFKLSWKAKIDSNSHSVYSYILNKYL